MKTKTLSLTLASIALALMFVGVHSVRAQGTTFTYQGRLLDAGSPASGTYDLRFTVWDSAGCPSGGLLVGAAVVVAPVTVSGGLFTVPLDFGSAVFTGPPRWLQIESRLFGGGGGYSTICPRQPLTASPYAITAGNLTGTLPASQLSGTVADGNLSANVALLNRNPQTFTGQNNFTANLGIGTTSPLTPLHAREGTGAGGLGFYSTPVIFGESQHGNGIIGKSAADGNCGVLGVGTSLSGGVGVCAYGGSYGITAQGADYGGSFTATGGSGTGVYASGNPAIYASGNVGIGTVSPDSSLTIANASGANYMTIKDGTREILMGVDATGGIVSVLSAHDLILRAGGNSEKMRIQAGGNVGIGTTTPAAQLDVLQGTGSGVAPDSAAIVGDAQTDSDGIWGASGVNGGNGVVGVCNNGAAAYGVWGRSTSGRGVVGSGSTYGGYFSASGTGLYASGVPAIQTSGSVGINASPVASLYVQGTTATTVDNTADFYNPSIGANHSHIHWGTLGHWYIRSAANAGCVIMQDQDPLGWVGIGGTPQTKLTVFGNICGTGTIGACSDARFKEHVQTLSGALETVLKLRGVQFNWRTREFPDHHFTEQPQVGFIAQEVNQALPEVVAQGKDGFYSVDYGRLTPVLVEAVKEQQEQLRAKDTKLAALEKANAEIQKELTAQKELTSRMEARFARLEKVVAGLGNKSVSTFAFNHEPAEAK